MKKLILIISFVILFGCTCVDAQSPCDGVQMPAGTVCLSQASVNKASELVDKYKAANEAVAALQAQVGTLQIAVKDRDDLIVKLKNLGKIDDQIHEKELQFREVMQSMLTVEADIIQRLQKQLTGGKTKMQRFLDLLKTAYYIIAGGAIIIGL